VSTELGFNAGKPILWLEGMGFWWERLVGLAAFLVAAFLKEGLELETIAPLKVPLDPDLIPGPQTAESVLVVSSGIEWHRNRNCPAAIADLERPALTVNILDPAVQTL